MFVSSTMAHQEGKGGRLQKEEGSQFGVDFSPLFFPPLQAKRRALAGMEACVFVVDRLLIPPSGSGSDKPPRDETRGDRMEAGRRRSELR